MRSIYIMYKAVMLAAAFTAATVASVSADVVISSDSTQNMTCGKGLCAPTATDAVLNSGDLENLLASGDLEVTTTGSGAQANNIGIATGVSWKSARKLTLDAYHSLVFSAVVKVNGTGGVSLLTNDGGTGGVLSFAHSGQLVFADVADALTINGVAYALENSLFSLGSYMRHHPTAAVALASDYDAGGDGVHKEPPLNVRFAGTLEGLGNSIRNVDMERPHRGYTYFGLVYANLGVIHGLRVTGAVVYAWKRTGKIGVLTGYNSGTIANCRATGSIVSLYQLGGIIGGLVGQNAGGTITDAHVDVNINFKSASVGGLAGTNESGVISLSYANGSLSGGYKRTSSLGGLVGFNSGTIDQSYATGPVYDVTRQSNTGGLVGNAYSGQISNSYAFGAVSAGTQGNYLGGFAGSDTSAAILSSYTISSLSEPNPKKWLGGFLGYLGTDEIQNAYWDTSTSGTTKGTGSGNVAGLTGLTSDELQSGLPAGFDPAIWAEQAGFNSGFPYLINNPPPY
jgi:hypothetical protein